jgi:hypothetical protein
MLGVKKVSGPLIPLHAPVFILIHICHTINDNHVSEKMIMNFLKYNYKIRSIFMNLSSRQRPLSTIDGERETNISHRMFVDEEPGLKKDPSRTRDQTWN